MDAPHLSVHRGGGSNRVVLELSGELDANTVGILESELANIDGDGPTAVLDLGGLEFIDSSGLGAIVAFHNDPEAAQLVLRGLSERVTKVFEYAGLIDHLDIR